MGKRKKRAYRPADGRTKNQERELAPEENTKISRGMQQDFLRALQETQPPTKLLGRVRERGKP